MHHHQHTDYVEVVSAQGPKKPSSTLTITCILLMIVGFGAFAFNAFLIEDNRTGWIAFLHNFYFFTGLSAAGVVIACIIHVTNAMWGRPIKRIAEAYGAFLPFSLVFIVILYFGAGNIYEFVNYPPDKLTLPNKSFWLQHNFWFVRCIFYLLVLIVMAHLFKKQSLRPDLGLAHEKNPDLWPQPSGWSGLEEEVKKSQQNQYYYSALYCLSFAVFISMLAYDLIMALDYRWISTMFGGWNFTTFMLIGWGSLHLMTHFMSQRFGLEKYMHRKMYHDLGKLTFGFTVVWGYLMFAQIMVIWYGNLGHETGWLITRIFDGTWTPYTMTALGMVFIIPFILGLSKNLKMSPRTFMPVVIISFSGVWLERFVQIAPASWYFDHEAKVFEGGVGALLFWDMVVFLGFAGLFCLTFTRYLYKQPKMVISDPRLDEGINRH